MSQPEPRLRHVWSLGDVTAELNSSGPLTPRHFQLLQKYVALAAEAAGETEPAAPSPLQTIPGPRLIERPGLG